MTDQDHLDRINALTRNARSTWFALLAALVFVGITLMRVEHIDFYGVDRATQLPLVNVEVPTRSFFVTAPILIAAIYGYFHLYLIRLWDALGAAPARLNGIRLGDAVTPWLVTDAALHFRRWMRRDNATTPRTLEGGAMALNFLLVWGFGLSILAALWWLSMPARTFWMTGIAWIAILACTFAGAASLTAMLQRLRQKDQGQPTGRLTAAPALSALVVLIPFTVAFSHQRTEGFISYLAIVDLAGKNITERPTSWLPYAATRAEFRAAWCRRENGGDSCADIHRHDNDFEQEFEALRASLLARTRRPELRKPEDLRAANLSDSFLAGADFTGVRLQKAKLTRAQMEGVKLRRANLQGATFFRAQMATADLVGAQMQRARLEEAQMQATDLREANMQEADLDRAHMQRADLRRAQLQRTNLHGARLNSPDLRGTQLTGAVLNFSQVTGTRNDINSLRGTNLSMSVNDGGMLRFLDSSEAIFDAHTDFRNAFLDGSVTVSPAFRAQMGNPCQWVEEVLADNATFYGRWRGWVEANPSPTEFEEWTRFAPWGYRDVRAIPPPPGCTWKTGPMPDATEN